MLVNRLAVRLLLVLSKIHIMNTKCIDFTLAYPQTGVKVPICLHTSRGIEFGKNGLKTVLKLKNYVSQQRSSQVVTCAF